MLFWCSQFYQGWAALLVVGKQGRAVSCSQLADGELSCSLLASRRAGNPPARWWRAVLLAQLRCCSSGANSLHPGMVLAWCEHLLFDDDGQPRGGACQVWASSACWGWAAPWTVTCRGQVTPAHQGGAAPLYPSGNPPSEMLVYSTLLSSRG